MSPTLKCNETDTASAINDYAPPTPPLIPPTLNPNHTIGKQVHCLN